MSQLSRSASIEEIRAYLAGQQNKDMLRFITCGSVDDGKSTLIGRLLWDSKLIFEDQLAALEADSRRQGTQGDNIDYALLLDGLMAEREQGITIDVAYRFFATDKRKFIVADTPGHEQYTRNMVTGASTARAAVILVDARKGILPQTRRHSILVSLMGIRAVVLAVNKMDLVDFSAEAFAVLHEAYADFARQLDFDEIAAIPVSALKGDNIITASTQMPWYRGSTLLAWLETVNVADDLGDKFFRLPVQLVNRPDHQFRGFSGTIAAGRVGVGDQVAVAASGQISRVSRIVTFDGDREKAGAREAVTLVLEDEIDISRGDLLVDAGNRSEYADQFQARLVWMHEEPLLPGRGYFLKTGTATVTAQVTELKYKLNIKSLEHQAAKTLKLNEIGVCNLALDRPVPADPYTENRSTGSFILIDKFSHATVGAGMIDYALRRATNIHWQAVDLNKQTRAAALNQQPAVWWFTGLSGSGKSTIANLVEKKLHSMGRHTYLLDGDNVRHGLNRDLGFTDADRVENIRRVAEVAKLFVDAGMIVLVSFISPFRSERQLARSLFEPGEFYEIYVDTPLEICEQRDVKGLYRKARSGQLINFTGVDSPYEPPENPEFVASAGRRSAEELAERIVEKLG
ncbi:MAG TPA: sulfate adenylyltransferase subunit CysN [Proteobacteria bacterium]|nr:sulfate adenylyltransferase subunit CysN [Pseudomonadota bacterium]